MVKYILSYFGFMGRAESIRQAFVIGGLPFTNKVISRAEFAEMKKKLPCGLLPVLEIVTEDKRNVEPIDQTNAILRYVGKQGGLYPLDPVEALKVDQVIYTVIEADKLVEVSVKGPGSLNFSDQTYTSEEKLEHRAKMMDPSLPHMNVAFFLRVLEKKLEKNNNGWFVGENVTIADLRAYQLIQWLSLGVLDGVPENCMDDYPRLKALHDNIEAHPAVAAFRKQYGKKYETFDYVPPIV